jgi:hypothetical protein
MLEQRTLNTGKLLEDAIEKYLRSLKFNIIKYSEFKNNKNNCFNKFGNKIVIKNYPYNSIYEGCNARTEFMVMIRCLDESDIEQITRFPIECKIQLVSGTVDEKYGTLLLNCLNREEDLIIIILEGNGAREGAKNFLRGDWKNKFPILAKNYSNKTIKTLDCKSFKLFIAKLLREKVEK